MAEITILGSGTAVSSSYPSGYLLKHENKNFLIDCGEGIRHRLAKVNTDYFDIEAVFMSHFHPDHFNIETLIQSIMVRNYTEVMEKSLTVYGPPETKERIMKIWDSKHNTGHFENILPGFVKLSIVEYEDRKAIELEGLKATPHFLSHGNMPAASLRFEIGNKVFTYSGDTGLNNQIGEAAKDADLFVCECNQRPNTENPGHLNPKQIGEIAKKNLVKRVVLTHMPNVDKDEDLVTDFKRAGFSGSISVGHDFDVLQLENA